MIDRLKIRKNRVFKLLKSREAQEHGVFLTIDQIRNANADGHGTIKDWMIQNLNCEWHYEGPCFEENRRGVMVTFSDLETATLFRLRF